MTYIRSREAIEAAIRDARAAASARGMTVPQAETVGDPTGELPDARFIRDIPVGLPLHALINAAEAEAYGDLIEQNLDVITITGTPSDDGSRPQAHPFDPILRRGLRGHRPYRSDME